MSAAMSANDDVDPMSPYDDTVGKCVCGHPAAWHQPRCIGCGCTAMSGREGR